MRIDLLVKIKPCVEHLIEVEDDLFAEAYLTLFQSAKVYDPLIL